MPQDSMSLPPWRHATFPSLGLQNLMPEQHEPQQKRQGFRLSDASLPAHESGWRPDHGVHSVDDSSGRLPKFLQETPASPPRVLIDENSYHHMHLDTCLQLGQSNVALPLKHCLELQFTNHAKGVEDGGVYTQYNGATHSLTALKRCHEVLRLHAPMALSLCGTVPMGGSCLTARQCSARPTLACS